MKWEDPPIDRRLAAGRSAEADRRPELDAPRPLGAYQASRRLEIDRIAALLRSRPGHWALVEHNVYPNSATVYKTRGLEVRYRSTGDGRRQDIYARCPATEEPQPAPPEPPRRTSSTPATKGRDPWVCAVCGHRFVVPSLARDCERKHQ